MTTLSISFTSITVDKYQRLSTAWLLKQWAYWLCVLAAAAFMLLGFIYSPNYFALRIVTIERVTLTTTQNAQGTWKTWNIVYSRHRLPNGQTEIGQRQLNEWEVPPSIRQADVNIDTLPGTQVLLRVPVAADEPSAEFAFNRQVRQGALLLSLLLVIRWHARRHELPFEKPALLQLVLIVAALGWLLIFGIPQGTD